jgi:hypothetical protein
MSEVPPYRETEIAKGDGLIILDEKGFSCSRARGQQVLHSEDVSICNVTHVGNVPQIEAVADNEWSLIFGDTCVDGWY